MRAAPNDSAPIIVLGGLLGSAERYAELGNRLDAIRDHYGFSVFMRSNSRMARVNSKGGRPKRS
jgi:hypothetical protein